MKKFLYWLPRILSILLICFISMFALDVFEEPQWFLGLIMHLIPSFILALITFIAWKHAYWGGILFIATGIFSLFFFHFETMIVFIPAVVIGILFLTEGILNKRGA
jgi:signal transduction histidine kinase